MTGSRRHLPFVRGGQRGPDDVVVAGTPAQVAFQARPHLFLGGLRVLLEQRHDGHHHARRAEPALQPVLLVARALHGVHLAVPGEPLNRGDRVPAGLGGEHRARLDGFAVEQHCAGPAGGGVAAYVGRGEVGHVAQEVHEQHAVLDIRDDLLAVDGQVDLHWSLAFWASVALWASLIAVHTRWGVAGMSTCRTPRCATASTTAFWTAGGAPMVPASPIPLTPSGVSVVGVSLSSSSKLRSSVAAMAA